MKKLIATIIFALSAAGCSSHKVDDIKAHADAAWAQAGFVVVGYEGYKMGLPGAQWGGEVWYIVRRKDDSGVLYHGSISKWFGEYEIYSLRAIDAIQPD